MTNAEFDAILKDLYYHDKMQELCDKLSELNDKLFYDYAYWYLRAYGNPNIYGVFPELTEHSIFLDWLKHQPFTGL